MIALICDWEGDLSISPSGDIAAVPRQSEVQSRIIRRLLTNPADYIWHTDYGAGLGSFVGEPYSPNIIEGVILNQLKSETLIARTPAPSVQITQAPVESSPTISVTVQFQIVGALTSGLITLDLGT
jgi:hypothetical protein